MLEWKWIQLPKCCVEKTQNNGQMNSDICQFKPKRDGLSANSQNYIAGMVVTQYSACFPFWRKEGRFISSPCLLYVSLFKRMNQLTDFHEISMHITPQEATPTFNFLRLVMITWCGTQNCEYISNISKSDTAA